MARYRGWNLVAVCSAGVLAGSMTLGFGVLQAGGKSKPQDSAGGEVAIGEGDKETVAEQRAQVRDRLVRRLEWTRDSIVRYGEHEQGLVRAIARLDAGESTEAISNDMRVRAEDGARDQHATDVGDRDGVRRGPRDWRWGRFGEPLDAESRRRVLSMLETQSPELFKKVGEFRKGNEGQTDRLLQRIAPKLNEIRAALESDPDLATLMIIELHANLELTFRSRDLRELLASDSQDEQEIALAHERIRDSVRTSFDAHLAIKAHEVQQLEEQLQKLRDEIERRKQMRGEFIDRLVDRAGSPTSGLRRRGPRG